MHLIKMFIKQIISGILVNYHLDNHNYWNSPIHLDQKMLTYNWKEHLKIDLAL